MNFWVRNLTLKLISRFSGGRNQPWAADRGMERALRQCPQQGSLPRAAVFPGISPPASPPGWPELVWALESPITPFAISLPTASPLFWSCPLSHIIARSPLPSVSFAALSPSPILTLITLSSNHLCIRRVLTLVLWTDHEHHDLFIGTSISTTPSKVPGTL